MPVAGSIAGGLAAGAVGSLFGGSKGGTTQAVQSNSPWAGAQPHLLNLFQGAQNLYNQGPFSYTPSPFTTQAQNLMVQRAQDPNSITGQTMGQLGDTISGKYLTPDSNPYLKASVEDALGLAGSAYAKQFGGAAGQNLGNSGYQESLARGLGAAATNAYSNAYGQERQNQLNAMQLAPTLGNLDASQLAGVGGQQEALAQQQYQSPWQNLAQYQAMISGQPGGSSVTQQPYFTNPLANALGLGLGGVSLYKMAGGGSLFGGPQTPSPSSFMSDPYAYYSGGQGLNSVMSAYGGG